MKKTNAIRLLEQQKIRFDTVPYAYNPDNLNLQVIADENNLELEKVFKTLVLKGNKTGILVTVVPGTKYLNLKALAKASGNKKIALVEVKKLLQLTGYIRGGCSPIGMKKNYPVFVDDSIEEIDKIYINAGVRGILVGLSIEDFKKVTKCKSEAIGSLYE